MTKAERIDQLNEQLSKCRANNDIAGFAAAYKQIELIKESK